jgi:hypothetical protein
VAVAGVQNALPQTLEPTGSRVSLDHHVTGCETGRPRAIDEIDLLPLVAAGVDLIRDLGQDDAAWGQDAAYLAQELREQVGPYRLAMAEVIPASVMCGGSKTTTSQTPSADQDRSRKSPWRYLALSGSMSMAQGS